MFWILIPTYPIFHALFVALGLKGCALDLQMAHPDWIGFTFYDTIYPLFLFLSGVSFPFSFASSRVKGFGYGRISRKIVRRAVVLVLLGSTIFGSLQLDPKTLSLCSVLGRIGISCGVASFVYLFVRRWQARAAICAGILLVYWFLPFFVGCPGASPDVSPYASPDVCIYMWLDDHFYPRPLFGAGFSGLFPMVATAMIGMFAGDWLRGERTGGEKVRGLTVAAVALTALGVLAATAFGRWSVPVAKNAWTTSFALASGGYSLAMLALFYWIVDVKKWRAWSFFFRVIGMNAVFAYLASRTIIFPWKPTMNFLFGGVMARCPTPEWGAFAGQLGYLVAYWLLLLLLYRKGIFLKA